MKIETKTYFILREDAKKENSNGIAKIILNILRFIKIQNLSIVILGKERSNSAYKKFDNVIYLNHKESFINNIKLQYGYKDSIQRKKIFEIINRQNNVMSKVRLVIWGAILSPFFLNQLRSQNILVSIALIDSPTRYWFYYKNKNIFYYILSKTVFIFISFYYELFLRIMFNQISYVNIKDSYFIPFFKKKCLIIPNGVNVPKNLGFKHKKIKNLVFVGNLDYNPNRLAVEFIAENLAVEFSEMNFLMVGECGTKLQKKFCHIKNVTFTGYVENLSDNLKSNSILLIPIFSGSGIQNKILDGFAYNIPVIASKHSVSGIKCSPNKHYLEANSAHEFVYQINKICKNNDIAKKLSKNAYNLASNHYHWKKISQKYQDFIIGNEK